MLPPAQHQVMSSPLAIVIAAFNPHVQIVELFGSRGMNQDDRMVPELEADIRRLGDQQQPDLRDPQDPRQRQQTSHDRIFLIKKITKKQ